MSLGNLNLFFRDVAAHLDNLHAVQQGAGNGVEVVGRGDEHHMRQVIVNVQVVVVEGVVLFGIQNLEQCRGWVAVDGVLRHLVNLIEDEHRVGRTRLLQALDDTAGHRADIRSAVSAYLRFVVDAP